MHGKKIKAGEQGGVFFLNQNKMFVTGCSAPD